MVVPVVIAGARGAAAVGRGVIKSSVQVAKQTSKSARPATKRRGSHTSPITVRREIRRGHRRTQEKHEEERRPLASLRTLHRPNRLTALTPQQRFSRSAAQKFLSRQTIKRNVGKESIKHTSKKVRAFAAASFFTPMLLFLWALQFVLTGLSIFYITVVEGGLIGNLAGMFIPLDTIHWILHVIIMLIGVNAVFFTYVCLPAWGLNIFRSRVFLLFSLALISQIACLVWPLPALLPIILIWPWLVAWTYPKTSE